MAILWWFLEKASHGGVFRWVFDPNENLARYFLANGRLVGEREGAD